MEYKKEDFHLLLIRRLSGNVSKEEEEFIQLTLLSNEEARQLKDEVEASFRDEAVLKQLEDHDYRAGLEEILATSTAHSTKKRYIPIAAAILVLVIAGTLYFFLSSRQKPASQHGITLKLSNGRQYNLSEFSGKQSIRTGNAVLNADSNILDLSGAQSSSEWTTLEVPRGLTYMVTLSDSTTVHINAATTLRFPLTFSGSRREITISGEAYLNVTADEKKPFIVHAQNTAVQVLGTAFNVNTYDSGSVKVALVTGSVRVRAAKSEVVIKPGQQAIYRQKNGGIHIVPFDQDTVVSWRKGVYLYYDKTLNEVVQVASRMFNVSIVIDPKERAVGMFTGVIDKNKPFKEFLDGIQYISDVEYYFDKDSVAHFK